MSTANPNPKP